jgi:hypothetical protein
VVLSWKPTLFDYTNPLNPLLFGLYLDALEGYLDGGECDAAALTDVHVWLLLFADDLALMLESEVGLQQ